MLAHKPSSRASPSRTRTVRHADIPRACPLTTSWQTMFPHGTGRFVSSLAVPSRNYAARQWQADFLPVQPAIAYNDSFKCCWYGPVYRFPCARGMIGIDWLFSFIVSLHCRWGTNDASDTPASSLSAIPQTGVGRPSLLQANSDKNIEREM